MSVAATLSTGWESDLTAPEDIKAFYIPVEWLDHNPDNVREDYQLDDAFCASLATDQQVLINVVPIPDDYVRAEGEENYRFWVTKGNRRLAGARQVGMDRLLCLVDLRKAGDRAAQFLDMVVENDDNYRRGLTAFEQARALFEARKAGAKITQITKVTGRKREDVTAAITAGGLSEQTRQAAAAMDYEFDIHELSLLREFDDNKEALAEIHKMVGYGRGVRYAVERVRNDLAEEAEHARLQVELEAAGVRITERLPPEAVRVSTLAGEVEGFDAEAHATCSGHGVFFNPYNKTSVIAYCTVPDQHGYVRPEPTNSPLSSSAEGKANDGPARKVVIEGNKAWKASAAVRQEWIAALLARATAPKLVWPFVVGQLMAMPEPLCDQLGGAPDGSLYRKLVGTARAEAAAAARPGKLPLLALGPIAAAYEQQMTGTKAADATWRTDKWSPCKRTDAAVWLKFLAQLGYPLTPIEQAVADGVDYRGDNPAPEQDLADEPDVTQEEPDDDAAEDGTDAVGVDEDASSGPDEPAEPLADEPASEASYPIAA
ncbi:hypothetical protein ACFV1N_46035 [Streptosporangium canum]|uniref:ParB/RepB/Spo0J family partition protein n=1 Tax=Streptosporangium canum TaxID=324952 RepID=UPI003674D143